MCFIPYQINNESNRSPQQPASLTNENGLQKKMNVKKLIVSNYETVN